MLILLDFTTVSALLIIMVLLDMNKNLRDGQIAGLFKMLKN